MTGTVIVDSAYISGRDAFSDFAVNLGGQGVHSRALGKVRDHKVIQRHGKGQQETGKIRLEGYPGIPP